MALLSSVSGPISPLSSSSSMSSWSSHNMMEDIFYPESPQHGHIFTYKLIGDSVDKSVNPCYMTLDNQSKSLHYFHVYVILDRVDLSHLDNEPRILDVCTPDFLPFSHHMKMKQHLNFSHLIICVLKKHCPFSFVHLEVVLNHTSHIVSLGGE